MAEYFREEENQDVLLFIDNIYRYILAGMEVSAPVGTDAFRGGIPAHIEHRDGVRCRNGLRRPRAAASHPSRPFTCRADDYTDPGIVTTFGHLDAVVSLERSLAAQALYPAVDPLASFARILEPRIVGEEHYRVAPRRSAGVAAVPGLAGHHRYSGNRRTCRTKTGRRYSAPARFSAS